MKQGLSEAAGVPNPVFRAFNPRAPMRIYRRHLPHWRQDGCTYFVTFRLADSLPRHVLMKWWEQDELWLKARGINFPNETATGTATLPQHVRACLISELSEQDSLEFERRQVRRLHIELDNCHGNCLFRQKAIRACVRDALCHFHGVRWWVGDFVIMPNHIHGLWQPIPGHELESVLATAKGYISTQLTKLGAKKGKLWQQENYDRLVRDRKELSVWRRYIAANPESARLGEEEYTYHRCEWLD